MSPASLRSTIDVAVENLRDEALRRLADVRLAGAAVFLCIVSYLGFVEGIPGWRVYVEPLAFYGAGALALRAVSRPRLSAWAVPLLDVPAIFVLQYASMPLSPHPAGVAGWTLGLLVFFAVLSAFALDRQVLVATWVMTCICAGLLQRAADVGWGAVVASAVVLGLAASVTAMVGYRLISLIRRLVGSEVSRRLVLEQNAELERANAEVARVNAELQESQRNAETLTNLLVHDLKGPLAAMLSAFDLIGMRLEDGDDIAEIRIDLATGQRVGNRLLAMIGDLLGIARLEQLEFRPGRTQTYIDDLVAQVAKDNAHVASVRGIELGTNVPRGLTATVDEQLARRAIDNLVANALSFTPRGGRLEIAASRNGSDTVIHVRNDGPEIPPEFRERLFGKHAMLGARRGHNAGLGLYLCRLVATAHGGNIALVEEEGWAVSFALTLPDAQSGQAQEPGPMS